MTNIFCDILFITNTGFKIESDYIFFKVLSQRSDLE